MWALFTMAWVGALHDYVDPLWILLGVVILMALKPWWEKYDYKGVEHERKDDIFPH